MHNRIILLTLILLVLAACAPEREDVPGVLDVNDPTVVARQREFFLSATPPTPTPVPTRAPTATNTAIPTAIPPTSTPQVNRGDIVRETFRPGSWGTIFFTATDGSRHQLNEFQNRVVVIQTLSTVCEFCQEQTQIIAQVAATQANLGNTENVTILTLSIDSVDTLDELVAYQEQFGLASSDNLEWISGLASPDLITELGRTFGSDMIDENSGGLFFIDKSGFAHLSDTGFIDSRRFADILVTFIGGSGIDSATEEVTDPEPTANP